MTPATTNESITRHIRRYRDASRPRLFALSSPRARTLSLLEVIMRNAEPATVTTNIRGMSDQLASSNDPICHRYAP